MISKIVRLYGFFRGCFIPGGSRKALLWILAISLIQVVAGYWFGNVLLLIGGPVMNVVSFGLILALLYWARDRQAQ